MTFDHPPEDVTVSDGVATITDNTVTIAGPFTPGTLTLAVTWADGSETLTYTVRQPADFVSAEPAADSEITTNDSITLTFDHPPEDVTVSEFNGELEDDTTVVDVLVTRFSDFVDETLGVGTIELGELLTFREMLLNVRAGIIPLTALPRGVIKSRLTAVAVNKYGSERSRSSKDPSTESCLPFTGIV